MTNRIDLQVRVRHTVGKGRFGIQPIQAQQLHITESSKKINLKLNSRYLTTSVRLKDDSRPFFLSDSFQSVVHYYVSVDGMRQQEGPLKIMKSIKYRTGWEYDTWPRSSRHLEFGQSDVCQSDSINWGIE